MYPILHIYDSPSVASELCSIEHSLSSLITSVHLSGPSCEADTTLTCLKAGGQIRCCLEGFSSPDGFSSPSISQDSLWEGVSERGGIGLSPFFSGCGPASNSSPWALWGWHSGLLRQRAHLPFSSSKILVVQRTPQAEFHAVPPSLLPSS